MTRVALLFVALAAALVSETSLAALLGKPTRPVHSVHCMAIREEPGAPTYGFDLFREDDSGYSAVFLTYPGDENELPNEDLRIDGLNCEFDRANGKIFLCTKVGASVSGVQQIETQIPAPGYPKQSTTIYEMRALGIEVPDVYRVAEFRVASECSAKSAAK